MAQIIWKPRAIRQLNAIIDYSVPEFGMVAFKTIRDWQYLFTSEVFHENISLISFLFQEL